MFSWGSATDHLIREEVDEAFFRQLVEASHVQVLAPIMVLKSPICWRGITADLP